jgi:hypothetical protein
MCLLIYKPQNVTLPEEHLANGMRQNDDGAGFALQIPHKRTLYVSKGYWSLDQFLKAYREACAYYGGSPGAMIHFRFATGGKVNRENCHPFILSASPQTDGYADLALAHNGVLQKVSACENFSDTYHLARQCSQYWTQRAIKRELRSHVGPSNKFVLLSPNKANIIGEEFGQWDGGAWYSNGGYKKSFSRFTYSRGYFSQWEMDQWEDEDLETPPCVICDMPISRYRLGDSEIVCCWDCRKAIAADLLSTKESKVTCSWCHASVWERTPHYCTVSKPLPQLANLPKGS